MTQKLKDIRQFSGLTGRQLASILPCSYSQFSMAEGGKRNLPTPAKTLCNKLHQLLQQQQQTTTAKLATWPNDQNWVPGWLRKTRHKLNLAQELLTNLEEKLEKVQDQLAAAQLFQQHLQLAVDSTEAMELTLIERKASSKLMATNLKKQQLQLEAAGLKAQIDLAETWQLAG